MELFHLVRLFLRVGAHTVPLRSPEWIRSGPVGLTLFKDEVPALKSFNMFCVSSVSSEQQLSY